MTSGDEGVETSFILISQNKSGCEIMINSGLTLKLNQNGWGKWAFFTSPANYYLSCIKVSGQQLLTPLTVCTLNLWLGRILLSSEPFPYTGLPLSPGVWLKGWNLGSDDPDPLILQLRHQPPESDDLRIARSHYLSRSLQLTSEPWCV